eukprot:4296554-Lingulodinium_polyedra.AAC.1
MDKKASACDRDLVILARAIWREAVAAAEGRRLSANRAKEPEERAKSMQVAQERVCGEYAER